MDAQTLRLCRHNFWCVRELIRNSADFGIDGVEGWTDMRFRYSEADETTLEPGNDFNFLFSFQYTDEKGQDWEGDYVLEDFEQTRFQSVHEFDEFRTTVLMPATDTPLGSFDGIEFFFVGWRLQPEGNSEGAAA